MGSSLHGLEVLSEALNCCGLVTLKGEVDIASAPLVNSHVEALTKNAAKHFVFDCEGMSFLDSSGLHALEQARRVVDGDIGLVGTQMSVRRLFEIVGLSEDYPDFDTIEGAQAYLHDGRKRLPA